MFKPLYIILSLFFLTAFDVVKDAPYYRENIDEAKELLEGACKQYTGSGDFFVKDVKCANAQKAIEKDAEAKERDELIRELQKIKKNITKVVKIEKDSDKIRYSQFRKNFKEHPELVEDFIVSCVANSQRFSQNGIECMASIEVMLEGLEDIRARDIAALEKEVKYKEYYRQYFREHEDEMNELLDGRCKTLFANPWYEHDPELQDKQCNVAREERRRRKRLASIDREKEETEKEYDLQYYRNNLLEAENFVKRCVNEDLKSCDFARQAVEEKLTRDKLRVKYTDQFKNDLLAAKEAVDGCKSHQEKDNLKCEVASVVITENIKNLKEKSELERYVLYYKANISEAKKLTTGRCKEYSGIVDEGVFIEDDKCSAAKKVLDEEDYITSRDALFEELSNIRKDMSKTLISTDKNKSEKYIVFKRFFKGDFEAAENFIYTCISDKEQAKARPLQCIASVDAMLEDLEEEKRKEVKQAELHRNKKEYYRKYFLDNKGEIDKILEGRCKVLFSNPWYKYDPDTADEECEAARAARLREERRLLVEREESIVIKDTAYFKERPEERKEVFENCASGVVDNLSECEVTMQIKDEEEENKKKRVKYHEHYKDHILAAKFHLRWCKSAMLNFNVQCQVVNDILKDHKDKELDEAKVKEYSEFFTHNPFDAKIVALGKCRDLLKDSWYFLDVNIQTEECNAAYMAVR